MIETEKKYMTVTTIRNFGGGGENMEAIETN